MAKDETERKEKSVDVVGSPPTKKKYLRLIAIGSLVILLIGGVATFFILQKGGRQNESVTETDKKGAHKEETLPHEAASTEADKKLLDTQEKKEGKGEKKHEESNTNEAHKAEDAASPTTPPTEETNPGMGDSYRFETFHLNLGNPLYNHYIRMNLSVEYRNGELQRNEIEKRKDQLRDIIISVTGKKTREFLLSPDGKDQLRLEITKSINRYLQQPIQAVYITDFLIE
jgi:flagellar basal body-associated protein FliL